MGLESTVVRSRKIRFYPSKEQRRILRRWFGAARFIFNKTVEYLKQPGTKANWMEIKLWLLKDLPDWCQDVPFQIKAFAIKDACDAVKNAKKKYKTTGQFQEVKFRRKKARNDSIFIPKQAIRKESFYVSEIGSLFVTEQIGVAELDCRVIFQNGRYFLCKPEKRHIKEPENQRSLLVALDPGVRTFQTFYSPFLAGKMGAFDFGRIQRLCSYLDRLVSKISKAKCRQKRRMRRAAERIRWKIKDLISEIHFKTANFFCKRFQIIAIPPFQSSQMVTKLRSKTARAMLTWSHYKFLQILKSKANEYSCMVLIQNEAWTSRTCSACGKIHNIGGKKILVCSCGTIIDRDFNGARGIFLRALVDTPWLDLSSLHSLIDSNIC
jgi:putative transposase